jgi:hypothetical protein
MDKKLKIRETKIGTKAICKMCGEAIIYAGPYWKHDTGDRQPRHPAIPKEPDESEPIKA